MLQQIYNEIQNSISIKQKLNIDKKSILQIIKNNQNDKQLKIQYGLIKSKQTKDQQLQIPQIRENLKQINHTIQQLKKQLKTTKKEICDSIIQNKKQITDLINQKKNVKKCDQTIIKQQINELKQQNKKLTTNKKIQRQTKQKKIVNNNSKIVQIEEVLPSQRMIRTHEKNMADISSFMGRIFDEIMERCPRIYNFLYLQKDVKQDFVQILHDTNTVYYIADGNLYIYPIVSNQFVKRVDDYGDENLKEIIIDSLQRNLQQVSQNKIQTLSDILLIHNKLYIKQQNQLRIWYYKIEEEISEYLSHVKKQI